MKCICCNSNNTVVIGEIPPVISFAGRILDKPLNGGSLISCRNCNVSFRYPQLDKSSLDDLYRQGKSDNWHTPVQARKDWQIAGDWISKNIKYSADILDIGCFNGIFLNTLDKSNRLFGIEIHPTAANSAEQSGIKIIGKDFTGLEDITVTFDVVTSFDVIEHTYNPNEFLKQAARLTEEGGHIIISTGNSDAPSWKLLGSRYWYCTIGEHISFINPIWCERASKKLGLELIAIYKFSHAQLTLKKRLGDIVKNVFYLLTPKGFALFRQMGMGGNEYRNHKEMLKHPPSWITAKDHFICILRKTTK